MDTNTKFREINQDRITAISQDTHDNSVIHNIARNSLDLLKTVASFTGRVAVNVFELTYSIAKAFVAFEIARDYCTFHPFYYNTCYYRRRYWPPCFHYHSCGCCCQSD